VAQPDGGWQGSDLHHVLQHRFPRYGGPAKNFTPHLPLDRTRDPRQATAYCATRLDISRLGIRRPDRFAGVIHEHASHLTWSNELSGSRSVERIGALQGSGLSVEQPSWSDGLPEGNDGRTTVCWRHPDGFGRRWPRGSA
jgi:hypothetical protein